MKTTFLLTEPEVDDLLTKFRRRRDDADADGRHQEAAAWSQAIHEIEVAQLESFQRRAAAPAARRRRLAAL